MPATEPPSAELLDLASRAARAAGELLIVRALAPATGVSAKSTRTDLVSDADRDAEALIVAAIRAERPGDAITAEEGAATAGASGLRWLVDPLDGTINYLWGIPHWCVSVAAADGAGAVAGVVHDPSRGETFTAARGAGAALDGRPLRLGEGPLLDEALLATGFNYARRERERQAARLAHVLPRVRDVRRFGAAALDPAGGALLVTEAGGAVQQLPARSGSPAGVLASRAALSGPLRDLVDASYG